MEKKPTFIRRNPSLIARMIDGAYVILDPAGSKLFELNETASAIWDFLKRKSTVETIIRKVESQYDAPPHKIQKDVADFVKTGIKSSLFLA